MTKQSIAKLFVLAAGIATVPTLSMAGTSKEVKEVKEVAKESCITGDIGFSVVSQYVSRGVVLENQEFIIQPYMDLYFKLLESDGFLNKITLNLGVWSSFHSRKTDQGAVTGAGFASTSAWYEFDFTAGVSFTFAKNFTFTPSYYSFLSPNDGFNTFQGLNLKLAYDTTDALGFNLAPAVQVLFELENKAGTGTDEGIYYELSVAPSFPIGSTGLTVTVPLAVGLGSDGFYQSFDTARGEFDNETFGFASAGASLGYTLAFIPECYGTWTASAGYTFYYLGDGTSDFNTAERGGSVRDANETEHVFSGGLMVAF